MGLLEKLGRGFLGDNIKKVKKKFSSIFFNLYLLTPPFFFGTPNLVWHPHFFHHPITLFLTHLVSYNF